MLGNSTTELILHIGLPKTGTTAIQRHMYFNREALAKQGIYWAETYPRATPDSVVDWAHHIYSHKWGGWLDPKSFAVTPDEAWRALGESIRANGGRHILSSEWFSAVLPSPIGKEMLAYVVEAAAHARVKIIAYVRRHDELSESNFREVLKDHKSLISVDDYIVKNKSVTFMYAGQSLQMAAGVIGKENIIVRVYDRKRLWRRDSVSDFYKACGIPLSNELIGPVPIINPSFKTLTCKVISDPRVLKLISTDYRRFAILRKFLNHQRFMRFNKFTLLDTARRLDIMQSFNADAAKIRVFLSDDDAKALDFDPNETYDTIQDSELIFTQKELTEFREALALPEVPADSNEDRPVLSYNELIELIVSTWE